MHWIANILVGIGAAVASLFGGAQHLAGTTVTTILGSDTLSNSRTTINDNFAALLNGKQEISDLVSTTTWARLSNGVVTVANGGTASTSLSSNQVLLGNGTSGFKTVAGWGTSGASLVSNGAGLAPTWQSISFDTTASYNLTGSYVGILNFNASSTASNPAKFNGVSYSFPSSQPSASSTQLLNDGSGNLSWGNAGPITLAADGTVYSTNNTSSTTVRTIVIPAGLMRATSVIQLDVNEYQATGASPAGPQIYIGDGSATSSVIGYLHQGSNLNGFIRILISNAGSKSVQRLISVANGGGSASPFTYVASTTSAVNTANQFYISLGGNSPSGGGVYQFISGFVATLTQ